MCERASMYFTKHDEFYLPRELPGSVPSESHTEIRVQHGLPDAIPFPAPMLLARALSLRFSKRDGAPMFSEQVRGVSVECLPPDGNYQAAFYHWKLKVDQDIQPVWARDTSELLTRAHNRLPDWAKSRVMLTRGADGLLHHRLFAAGLMTYWPPGLANVQPYPWGIARESLPPPILKAFAHELALDGEHVPCLNADDLLQALEEHRRTQSEPPGGWTEGEAVILGRAAQFSRPTPYGIKYWLKPPPAKPLQCGKTQAAKVVFDDFANVAGTMAQEFEMEYGVVLGPLKPGAKKVVVRETLSNGAITKSSTPTLVDTQAGA